MGQLMFQMLCCVAPLGLVGLFASGLSLYALITGKGGAWIRERGLTRYKAAASPTATRITAIVGLIVGLMILCMAASVGLALVLYGGSLQTLP